MGVVGPLPSWLYRGSSLTFTGCIWNFLEELRDFNGFGEAEAEVVVVPLV